MLIKQNLVRKFPFKPNAYVNNVFYLLKGNGYSDKLINPGDSICIIDVIGHGEILEIVCKIDENYIHGYIKNTTQYIKYKKQGEWFNESDYRLVYLNADKNCCIGSLSPFETATPLYYKDGATCIVFNTPRGINSKSGFVFDK